MNVGGYQIIDFKNHNFQEGMGFVIDGIYDKIESTRKPILVTGLILDEYEYRNKFVDIEVNGSNFELDYNLGISGKHIRITVQDTDVVTVAEI